MKYSGNTLLIFLVLLSMGAMAQDHKGATSLEGRWDLLIKTPGRTSPSWLEVRHSGFKTLVGRFVYAFGSARPVSKVTFDNGKFSFTIPQQWEQGPFDMTLVGQIEGDSLRGTLLYPDGKIFNWSGGRTPALRRPQPNWGAPVALFNGKDLKGWHADGNNQWIAENGVLRSPKSGSNLLTDEVFDDFKLHLEFRYPQGSNSGVYLRGRYEVQITDSKGLAPMDDQFSGIYGFLSPSENTAKEPGEWQSFDITLVGRMVTVVANGVTVISNQEIPGITGGAINSREGEPGPILFQGDHGPIEFRNITLAKPVR